MLSPYGIQPNDTNRRSKKASNTNIDNNSHRDLDVKRPQKTSNDLETTQTNTISNRKNKIILKTESIHKNIEVNNKYLHEILDKHDI